MDNQLAEFHGTTLAIVDHEGKKWITSRDAGLALGYAAGNANDGVNKLCQRHGDEFTEADTCTVKLTAQGQLREVRVFSETGCVKLGFFASTPRSKEFRQWAAKILTGQAPAQNYANGRLDPIDSDELLLAAAHRTLLNPPRHIELWGAAVRYREMGLAAWEIGKIMALSENIVQKMFVHMRKAGLDVPDPAVAPVPQRPLEIAQGAEGGAA